MKRKTIKYSGILIFSSLLFFAGKIYPQGITVGSGTTVTINSAKLKTNGDIDNNGTFNNNTTTMIFSGSSGDEIISGLNSFNNLIINKSAGNLVASGDVTVNGTLTCTSGNFDLNGNTCTLSSSGTVSESSGNEIIGGTISITKSLNQPSSVNPGNLGIEISSDKNLGNTVITRGSAIQTANGNQSIKKYFDINPTNDSNVNGSLVLHYFNSDLNGLSESNLRFFKSDDNGTTWTEEGGAPVPSSNLVAISGINSFSRWTLGSNASPLPVEMVNFYASTNNSRVLLKWNTATEVENAGFEIQRASVISEVPGKDEKLNWQKIGFVKGAGNSNAPKNYSFLDKNPTGGSRFKYRIKEINNNGDFKFTKTVLVKIIPRQYSISQNYPNPFNPSTTIRYEIPKEGKVFIKLYDELGREVKTLVNKKQQAGRYELTFNASDLASGIYFYRIRSGNFTKIKKMILMK